MHDLLVIGVPVLVILAGILFNNSNAKDLRAEMKDFRSEIKSAMKELRSQMNSRFDLVDAELRYFHGKLGTHEARIDAIEKRT